VYEILCSQKVPTGESKQVQGFTRFGARFGRRSKVENKGVTGEDGHGAEYIYSGRIPLRVCAFGQRDWSLGADEGIKLLS
jgi:hypothetical protein